MGGGGGWAFGASGIQPLVTASTQIMIGGRTNTEPSLPRTAHISAGNMNERGRERTAAGLGTVGRRWAGGGGRGRGGSCLLTLTRVSNVF